MSLSTCECGGHIPLGPDASNRCEKCGAGVFGFFQPDPKPFKALGIVFMDAMSIEDHNQSILAFLAERDALAAKVAAQCDEFRAIVQAVADRYPVEVWPDPVEGASPDRFSAAGARLACRGILAELETLP